ncbi:SSD domain-containing protein [Aphelenchoides fujianensis]|nr:SSD domain-containing protein [Aphelenchoides fujianensis]
MGGFLERAVAGATGRVARWIARHPLPFILVPLLLTAVLAVGIWRNLRVVRGVQFLYSPQDADWKREEAVFRQRWTDDERRFFPGRDVLLRNGVYLLVSARDGGDVLRPPLCRQLIALVDAVANFSFVDAAGEQRAYADVCFRFQNECFRNAHVRLLAEMFADVDEVGDSSHPHPCSRLFVQKSPNVSFPLFSARFLTEPLDLSTTLGGVRLDASERFVRSAKAWLLVYQLKGGSRWLNPIEVLTFHRCSDFQHKLPEFLHQRAGGLLAVDHFHSEAFDDALETSAAQMAPRFGVTFGILVVLSVAWTFSLMRTAEGALVVDWVHSKPLLGVAGVLCTLLAIVSGVGALLWAGVAFPDVVAVMPFLCLTIGVDDCFLLLAEWRSTDARLSAEERLVRTLEHAGTSIFVTSCTDALAFLIGAVAPLPAVTFFCCYASVCIAFIFAYVLTLFAACLLLQGPWEERSRHSVLGIETRETAKSCDSSARSCGGRLADWFRMGSRLSGEPTDLWYQRFFADTFAPFLCRSTVQLVAFFSFVLYVLGIVAGLQRDEVDEWKDRWLQLENLLTADSPTKRFLELRATNFAERRELDVAVLRPPNLGNRTERAAFFAELRLLETDECCAGPNRTDFWFRAYERFVRERGFGELSPELDLDSSSFREQLAPFLLADGRAAYDLVVDERGELAAFRFAVGLAAFRSDARLLECARRLRALCRRSAFGLVSHSSLWNLADQFGTLWGQTMQDVGISVGVMTAIAALFLSPPVCSLVVGTSIVSVSFGVLGWMPFWGVKLDATSMISVAMSVGFSVDFAAHVSYSFCSSTAVCPRERLRAALRAVGWPITQASAAVLLGILTLGTADAFIVQTCFKFVLLVVVFGYVHALVYLPLALMHATSFVRWISSAGEKK